MTAETQEGNSNIFEAKTEVLQQPEASEDGRHFQEDDYQRLESRGLDREQIAALERATLEPDEESYATLSAMRARAEGMDRSDPERAILLEKMTDLGAARSKEILAIEDDRAADIDARIRDPRQYIEPSECYAQFNDDSLKVLEAYTSKGERGRNEARLEALADLGITVREFQALLTQEDEQIASIRPERWEKVSEVFNSPERALAPKRANAELEKVRAEATTRDAAALEEQRQNLEKAAPEFSRKGREKLIERKLNKRTEQWSGEASWGKAMAEHYADIDYALLDKQDPETDMQAYQLTDIGKNITANINRLGTELTDFSSRDILGALQLAINHEDDSKLKALAVVVPTAGGMYETLYYYANAMRDAGIRSPNLLGSSSTEGEKKPERRGFFERFRRN